MGMNEANILVADDEAHIRRAVIECLSSADRYPLLKSATFLEADNPEDALKLAVENAVNVCVLDLRFLDTLKGRYSLEQGYELIEQIRQHTVAGIVVLSSEPIDYAMPLSADKGADFYVEKDLGSVTRTNMLSFCVNRSAEHWQNYIADQTYFGPGDFSYQFGDYEFQFGHHVLVAGDTSTRLTQLEYVLMRIFSENAPHSVSAHDIYRELYGDPYRNGDKRLSNLLSRLRAKLNDSFDLLAGNDGTYRIDGPFERRVRVV